MKVAWLTDTHFDFVDEDRVVELGRRLRRAGAEAVFHTGDVSVASSLCRHLDLFADAVGVDVYFVLGNHDYYGAGIEEVRTRVRAHAAAHRRLERLDGDVVHLIGRRTAVCGTDGWGDARAGDFMASPVLLNDYLRIRDLAAEPSKEALRDRLRRLGDEEAAAVRSILPMAMAQRERVWFLTHVPPFVEACWYRGRTADDAWAPHFTCEAVGEALLEVAEQYPASHLEVLCGHTHSPGECWMRENLRVRTGGAEYHRPDLVDWIEL